MTPEQSAAYRPELAGWSLDILPFYRKIVPGLGRPTIVVEVGAFRGRSLIFLAEELSRLPRPKCLAPGWRPASVVFGIDPGEGIFGPGSPKRGPHLGHAYPGFEGASHEELLANLDRTKGARPGVDVHVFREPSPAAARYFLDTSLAMVFLDGDHEPEAVRADIVAWTPKLAPGGILAGHDYGHYAWPGVKAVVDELRDRERAAIEQSVWWLTKPEGEIFR